MKTQFAKVHVGYLAAIILPMLVQGVGDAAQFTVTTLADSGAGSLPQAVLDANANGTADEIVCLLPAWRADRIRGRGRSG